MLVICILNYKIFGIGWTIGLPIIVGYALFADVYCIFSDTWISDLFMEVSSWTIKMPGIIFTFDLDGIKFLIFMKILLWILGILCGVGIFLLAVALSAFFSIFTFPFTFRKNR